MTFICMKMNMQAEHISIWFQTPFHTEEKKQLGNGLIATIFSILRAELHVPQVNDSLW